VKHLTEKSMKIQNFIIIILIIISSSSCVIGKTPKTKEVLSIDEKLSGEKILSDKKFIEIKLEEVEEGKQKAVTKSTYNLDSNLNFLKKFEISWLGIDVVNFYVESRPVEINGGVKYKSRIYIKTLGVADRLTGYRSNNLAYVSFDNGFFSPYKYKSETKFRKKIRKIELGFDGAGKVISDINNPPENRAKRPEVEKKYKNNSIDPVTAFFLARQKVMELRKTGKYDSEGVAIFSLPVYDGRRRMDARFEVFQKSDKDGLIKLSLREVPISGYTNNEMKTLNNGDRRIEIYLDPTNFLPVRAKGISAAGSATAYFVKDCVADITACVNE
jgi:hypothetical protein